MKSENLSQYIEKFKKVEPGDKTYKNLKIALLSSSTIKGLKEVLAVKCHELGLSTDIYVGEYNQYNQEIFNDESKLYQFEPDLTILFIDTRLLLGDALFDYHSLPPKKKMDLFKSKKELIFSLIIKMRSRLKGKIIVHNFEVPTGSPFGIMENKQEFGLIEFMEKINEAIREEFKADPKIFIFDYNAFLSEFGKKHAFDHKLYYLADIKIDLSHMPLLVNQYLAYIKPLVSLTKKGIVLDLDNTLWGGIVAEDGLAGIKLGPSPEGRPYMEFQKYLLSLYNRGVVLAINSKNNPDEALEVLRDHPHMVLKEEHFSSIKINWDDKITNMKAISQELNLGLDSLIFIDDDKLNCEMVRSALPQVKVISLPEDAALYLQTIKEIDDFNTFQITEDDARRGEMYAQQKARAEFGRSAPDLTAYLKGLSMKAIIQRAGKFNIPRISQLTQKTNQFNLTTRRYLVEEIIKLSTSPDCIIFSVKVEDKFGDNGITGAAIVKKNKSVWTVDSFLLSCRVIGRGVEEVMLAYIFEEARREGASMIIGEFIRTKKNEPAKDFYRKCGFKLVSTNDLTEVWECGIAGGVTYPAYIEVVKAE